MICVEDLNLKGMQKIWGRKIGDLGHGQFLGILASQCSKVGSVFVKIPRFAPTSKTCSDCDHVLSELPLKVRQWQCPACGAEHDRDMNAAKNILRVGTSTLGRDGVRPA
jgi:putative transposase